MALFWRDGDLIKVEEKKIRVPNVLTFELVMGKDRYFVVGAYITPTDLTTIIDVENAWHQCPKGANQYS